ncbi:MAG: tetratricopeptide repeat protein [Hyphomonadaceae bacterium]
MPTCGHQPQQSGPAAAGASTLSEAEPLMRRALAIKETSFGPDHPNVAICLNNLARLLQATTTASAKPSCLIGARSPSTKRASDPDHPEVAVRLHQPAGLLQATNRLSDAEPLYRRALAIDETSFGPDQSEGGHPPQQLAWSCLLPPTASAKPSR